MTGNPWFGQIIFGKAGEPKLNVPLWLLLFSRGFLSISPFIAGVPLCCCGCTKVLHIEWNTFMLDTVHTQKLLSLHQRSDTLR